MRNDDQDDPVTLIGLLFRIVDVPRRTLAATALLMLIVAVANSIRFPLAELARDGTLCGGGCALPDLAGFASAPPTPLAGVATVCGRGSGARRLPMRRRPLSGIAGNCDILSNK